MLIPTKNIVDELEQSAEYEAILKTIEDQVEREKQQSVIMASEQQAAEKELEAYQSIDWHEFVVVQTIDFQESETSEFFG